MKTKPGKMTTTDHRHLALRVRLAERLLRTAAMEVLACYPVTSRAGRMAERVSGINCQTARLRNVLDSQYFAENLNASRTPYYGATLRDNTEVLGLQVEQAIAAIKQGR